MSSQITNQGSPDTSLPWSQTRPLGQLCGSFESSLPFSNQTSPALNLSHPLSGLDPIVTNIRLPLWNKLGWQFSVNLPNHNSKCTNFLSILTPTSHCLYVVSMNELGPHSLSLETLVSPHRVQSSSRQPDWLYPFLKDVKSSSAVLGAQSLGYANAPLGAPHSCTHNSSSKHQLSLTPSSLAFLAH